MQINDKKFNKITEMILIKKKMIIKIIMGIISMKKNKIILIEINTKIKEIIIVEVINNLKEIKSLKKINKCKKQKHSIQNNIIQRILKIKKEIKNIM